MTLLMEEARNLGVERRILSGSYQLPLHHQEVEEEAVDEDGDDDEEANVIAVVKLGAVGDPVVDGGE